MNSQPAATLIDLSHTVKHGMVTYRGLPGPAISDFMSREDSRSHYSHGTEFHIGRIDMVANTGTYLDSPFHRFADGDDLSQLRLESLANLPGLLLRPDLSGRRAITAADFAGLDVRGKAVLVQTNWCRHWGSNQYYEGHPYLTEDAAILLRDGGATLVGVDTYNIDSTDDGRRPVHTTLLRAGIPIVEHMCSLEALPANGFRFFAVPVKVTQFGTFPVRAFALL